MPSLHLAFNLATAVRGLDDYTLADRYLFCGRVVEAVVQCTQPEVPSCYLGLLNLIHSTLSSLPQPPILSTLCLEQISRHQLILKLETPRQGPAWQLLQAKPSFMPSV